MDPTIRRCIAIFFYCNIWQKDGESNLRCLVMRALHFTHYISLPFILITCGIRSENAEARPFIIFCALATTVVIMKAYIVLLKKEEILTFLNDPVVSHCITDQEESVEVTKKLKNAEKFNLGYFYMLLFTISTYAVVPIFYDQKTLPGYIEFSSESEYATILFYVAYAYMTSCTIFGIFFTFLMIFIWYIMLNYSIEYKLLGNRFRRLSGATYQQDFVACVNAHRNLFRTIERFRDCFSGLFLIEISTAAMMICISTYSLSFHSPDNILETGLYIAGMTYSFLDIFITMYLSNEITFESDRLSYCLFESGWIDQSRFTKRCVIILGEMIRQPQVLVVLIYCLNLETFTAIANSAYSMFNILQNLQ